MTNSSILTRTNNAITLLERSLDLVDNLIASRCKDSDYLNNGSFSHELIKLESALENAKDILLQGYH